LGRAFAGAPTLNAKASARQAPFPATTTPVAGGCPTVESPATDGFSAFGSRKRGAGLDPETGAKNFRYGPRVTRSDDGL